LAPRSRRILICEDSRTYAKALQKFLEHDPEIEVVGAFETAEAMLPNVERLDPDLITMDLEMPGMGGVRAIEAVMDQRAIPILVISDHAGKGSERAAEALAAGALEALPKTGIRLTEPDDLWARAFRSRVKRLASVQLRRRKHGDRPRVRPRPPAKLRRPTRVIAIGASTGGPPALTAVLRELPADFEVPVLVVQHIAAGFVEGLVTWMDQRLPLPARVAAHGAKANAGIWFAPDDAHLRLDSSLRFGVDEDGEAAAHRPSVDVLFRSIAESAGEAAVGVVLTGMGRDGARGVEEIRAVGGLAIAQDEGSSAVFGMPMAAIESGADLVLPLNEIGPALSGLRVPEAAR
jgi:two-component system, chemotaxis family, protein-glutamate methylesterase/glutaminase